MFKQYYLVSVLFNRVSVVGLVNILLLGCAHQPVDPLAKTPPVLKPKPVEVTSSITPSHQKPDSPVLSQVSDSLDVPSKPWVQIGRYRVLNPEPTPEQRDPLQVIIQMALPTQVRTVGEAVQYILQRSGYRFNERVGGEVVHRLLNKQLPDVHRQFGPMTLQNALEMLAGSPFRLTIDRINRVVDFQLLTPMISRSHS